jgi:hypothetical protein
MGIGLRKAASGEKRIAHCGVSVAESFFHPLGRQPALCRVEELDKCFAAKADLAWVR